MEKYRDGRDKSITGTAVIAKSWQYKIAVDSETEDAMEVETELLGGDPDPIWSKRMRDGLGRDVKVIKAGANGDITSEKEYDVFGNVSKESRAGLADVLYNSYYGAALGVNGKVNRRTVDSGADGVRLDETVQYYAKNGSIWYKITKTPETESRSKVSGFISGEMSVLTQSDLSGRTTTTVTTVDRSKALVARTTSSIGWNSQVAISRLGLRQSHNTPSRQAPIIYGYDGHGRLRSIKDPRTTLLTEMTYDGDGRVLTLTAPGKSISNTYYSSQELLYGMLKSSELNGVVTYYNYDTRGEMTHTWGAGTYPLRYECDEKGRRKTLRTYSAGTPSQWSSAAWPNVAESGLTTWNYYPGTTQLLSKLDTTGKGPTYTYWPSGLLHERTWARDSLKTAYTYNDAGELKKIDYGDSTPDVTFQYDSKGRQRGVIDAAGDRALLYTPDGLLDSEVITAAQSGSLNLLAGWALDPHASLGEIDRLQGSWSGQQIIDHSFGYNPATGLMDAVTDNISGTNAAYTYVPNSNLLYTTTVVAPGVTALLTSREWDNASRLKKIKTEQGSSLVTSYEAHYDALGRKEWVLHGDGTKWTYGYNTRNELTSARKRDSAGTVIPGYSFDYGFDSIGNRETVTVNGQTSVYNGGSDTLTQTARSLNQYKNRTVPPVVDISGEVQASGPVMLRIIGGDLPVNSTTNAGNFHLQVPVSNTTAQYRGISIAAIRPGGGQGADYVSAETGHLFVPANPEEFSYDEDGNLWQDGRWTYTWDAENRLVAMETRVVAGTPVAPALRLEFQYDYRGRRIWKKVSQGGRRPSRSSSMTRAGTLSRNWMRLGLFGGV